MFYQFHPEGKALDNHDIHRSKDLLKKGLTSDLAITIIGERKITSLR